MKWVIIVGVLALLVVMFYRPASLVTQTAATTGPVTEAHTGRGHF